MDTKLKADIAESAVTTQLLKRGYKVLRPVGDRMPYDLCLDVRGKLIRIQVKSAWCRNGTYRVDSRRTKTNRRRFIRARYKLSDFDFAIVFIPTASPVFYIMPVRIFCSYKSEITFAENPSRQRKPKSYTYREAWQSI